MIIMESSVFSYIASLILLWHRLPLIESSVNLALYKDTSQSSVFGSFTSSKAVDGMKVDCWNDGFAHTVYGTNEWWQVDLGQVVEIKKIQIYYRLNLLSRLDGYAINITKSLNPLETWQCYKDIENGIPQSLTPSHICRRLGRYVIFSRKGNTTNNENAVINLCELEVYGCPQSRYGNGNCNSSCSLGCINSRCDPDNGQCNCSNGLWSGDKCDHINCNTGNYLHDGRCVPCPTGCVDNYCNVGTGVCAKGCKPTFYGKFCNLTCTKNCYNTSCATDSGQCIGCKVGLHGDKCEKICQWNCKDKVCKQDDGYCTNCNHPYKGITCTECTDGKYGENCDKECPSSCYLTQCNKMDGSCSAGCINQNRIGSRCEACVVGLYGKDCDVACPVNCKHRMCDGTDGTCMFGCKYANMTGNQCDGIRTTTEGLAFQINSYIGTIIAGVVSLINIVLILVVLTLYCKRRRRKETVYENQKPLDWTQEGMNQQDNYNIEQQQTVHYEVLGLDDRGSVNTNSAEPYTGLNVNTEGRY